jgi:hypothetical protein
MNNRELFLDTYRNMLGLAVQSHPEEYGWYPKLSLDTVFARMAEALIRGSYIKDGRAFKATCKTLGIKYTYTAINAYIAEVQS